MTPTPCLHSETLSVRPRVVARYLFFVVAVFAGLNLLHFFLVHALHLDSRVERRLFHQVSLNDEHNISTFFSALLLLAAASLLALVGRLTADRRHWWGLAAVFLFLAVDEAAELHDQLSTFITQLSHERLAYAAGGYLHNSWVIPYTFALCVLSAFYVPFLWHLPARTRALFVAAGCLFVSGALGLEALEGHCEILYGYNNLYFNLLTTAEEVMEMSGVTLFIYALLCYLDRQHGALRWGIVQEDGKGVAA